MHEDFKEWLVHVRRDFHRFPELGMEEKRTADKIAQYLSEMGIEYKAGVAGTGIVGIIRGGSEGRTVALRADMDALPIQDRKNAEYRSRNDGKMHACGHDAHMAILLGTARVLNEARDSLRGNVKLFFQPAEETDGGAKPMIAEGAMENPHVDTVFGLHMDAELPVGYVGIKYGKMNAASDEFVILVSGKSAHGAYPHSGVDAIAAAGHIITALQTVVSRNVDPRDSAVLSIGRIKGGTAGNIICDRVEMRGIIRTLTPKTREMVVGRVKNIVETMAETFGAKGTFTRYESYPALINDDRFVDIVKASAERLLGRDRVVKKQEVGMGVEDFAYFLEKSPGAFFTVGCRNEERGIVHSLHNCMFDIDEDCLAVGVKVQVENVRSFLNSAGV